MFHGRRGFRQVPSWTARMDSAPRDLGCCWIALPGRVRKRVAISISRARILISRAASAVSLNLAGRLRGADLASPCVVPRCSRGPTRRDDCLGWGLGSCPRAVLRRFVRDASGARFGILALRGHPAIGFLMISRLALGPDSSGGHPHYRGQLRLTDGRQWLRLSGRAPRRGRRESTSPGAGEFLNWFTAGGYVGSRYSCS